MRIERELQVATLGDEDYIVEVEYKTIPVPMRINKANNDEYLADYELYQFPGDEYRKLGAFKRMERELRK